MKQDFLFLIPQLRISGRFLHQTERKSERAKQENRKEIITEKIFFPPPPYFSFSCRRTPPLTMKAVSLIVSNRDGGKISPRSWFGLFLSLSLLTQLPHTREHKPLSPCTFVAKGKAEAHFIKATSNPQTITYKLKSKMSATSAEKSATAGPMDVSPAVDKENRTSSSSVKATTSGYQMPWIERYRPRTLDDVVGNEETVSRLRAIAETGNLPNLILSGPPGSGKTTSVHALARQLLGSNYKDAVLELNASDSRGIDVSFFVSC
jgi:hypothetical protein